MSTTTTTRPAFRKPWTHGAKAYHEADSIAAVVAGATRHRNRLMVIVPMTEVGHMPCGACGVRIDGTYALNPGEAPRITDEIAWINYSPRSRTFTIAHYYCQWGRLMNAVLAVHDAMIGRSR